MHDTEKGRGCLPTPRLKHIDVGQIAYLAHDNQPRRLLAVSGKYGYFDDLKVSLCHPVNAHNLEFGYGGWRVRQKTNDGD